MAKTLDGLESGARRRGRRGGRRRSRAGSGYSSRHRQRILRRLNPNAHVRHSRSGGKQYRVEKGQSLLVDRLPDDEGAKVGLRAVMFRSDDDAVLAPKASRRSRSRPRSPSHERGEKIKVFKYKAKKGYRKTRATAPS